ncbi:MAG: 4-alpha-glucanotransferase, partial [Acidimicrobiia bacterium]
SLDTESAVIVATAEIAGEKAAIAPVIVAWDGRLPLVEPNLRLRDATIALESGEEIAIRIEDGSLVLDTSIPVGYHELHVNGGEVTSHVLSAPVRAHGAPHGVSGVISPVYSLRERSHDAGLGGLAELSKLADLCTSWEIDVVGTLPLLAVFPDQPSPYSPASRRAWNEIFVDFNSLPGEHSISLPRPPRSLWVDYGISGDRIRSELALYAQYVSETPRLLDRVEAFALSDPEIARYAEFMALADIHGRNWRSWTDGVDPAPQRSLYHRVVQWLMDEQLSKLGSAMRDRGQYLYLDLPVGCHPDGYDVWDDQELFAPAGIGAPPDTLFAGGQDWGLPAPIPAASRRTGHANFRKAVAKQLSVAGLLRIDHVMGIQRSWWVPHGADARDGAYVMQPADELFAIICIESVRAKAGVVGENLGTVPPEIRTGLTEHGLLGMVVAQDGSEEPGSEDLVALSSHDTPAFAAWWDGLDIEDHFELGVFDAARASVESALREATVARLRARFGTQTAHETRDALLVWLVGTPAAIALLNFDDLVMEERRQNVPGTDTERPNWRLRHESTIEDVAADEAFVRLLAELREFRPRPGIDHHGGGTSH